jgi:hypothetical protein
MFIRLSKKLSNFSMMFYRETLQLDKIDMWGFPNARILPKDKMIKFWLNTQIGTKIGRKMFSKWLLSQELMTLDAFKWEWKFSQLLCPDQTRATVARESIKIIFKILQVYVKYNSYMIEWSKTKYSLRKKCKTTKSLEPHLPLCNTILFCCHVWLAPIR